MNQVPERLDRPSDFAAPSGPPAQAPPTTPASTRAEAMLLEFLREHESPCPVCGYNLKALTRPVCPECGQALVLAVGAERLRLGWLLAAVAPGFFSGIAAIFLLVPIVGTIMFGRGKPPIFFVAVDLFGWSSGLVAILLAVKRNRFITLPPNATGRFSSGSSTSPYWHC